MTSGAFENKGCETRSAAQCCGSIVFEFSAERLRERDRKCEPEVPESSQKAHIVKSDTKKNTPI